MAVLEIPDSLGLLHVPRHIYCNQAIHTPLLTAFTALAAAGMQSAIKTWNGAFNIRRKTGSSSMSVHSWGYAVDINAAWNRYSTKGTMSPAVVRCFQEAGFEWGGNWKTPDPMHFEYRSLNTNPKGEQNGT